MALTIPSRRVPALSTCMLAIWISCIPRVAHAADIEAPKVLLTGVAFDLAATGVEDGAELLFNGRSVGRAQDGRIDAKGLTLAATGMATIIAVDSAGETVASLELHVIPGWVSVVPPLVAIVLAFLLRSVIPALFIGLYAGAWAVNGLTAEGAFSGLFETITIYVAETSIDPGHMAIILFTLLIGGMVGIVSRNGGMRGIVNRVLPFASTPKRGQGIVALLGVSIFFDDYANTMIVGNATRTMSDSLRISREKLAYLVDSTAAPVSTVAIITTWIGFQLGLIQAAIADIDAITATPYVLFLNSIAYSFYPFLAVFFVFLIVLSGKDFGPMLTAERRAREFGELVDSRSAVSTDTSGDDFRSRDGVECRARNAVFPILTMVVAVIGGLFVSGSGETVTEIIGSADAYAVLIWASLLGCLVAALLTFSQRLLSLNETVEAWLAGARFMLNGIVLLVLAWAVADVASALQTAPYLISVLGDALSPYTLPTVVFLLAAATAFASGSSWGVMAILMPLVVPLCWAVLQANGIADAAHMHILYSCIACVLTGAVWADHCSPISDTTVLSSLATGCDHMDHVRTQIPYALAGGIVSILLGTLPAGFGLPWWLLLPVGAAALVAIHRFLAAPVVAQP